MRISNTELRTFIPSYKNANGFQQGTCELAVFIQRLISFVLLIYQADHRDF